MRPWAVPSFIIFKTWWRTFSHIKIYQYYIHLFPLCEKKLKSISSETYLHNISWVNESDGDNRGPACHTVRGGPSGGQEWWSAALSAGGCFRPIQMVQRCLCVGRICIAGCVSSGFLVRWVEASRSEATALGRWWGWLRPVAFRSAELTHILNAALSV